MIGRASARMQFENMVNRVLTDLIRSNKPIKLYCPTQGMAKKITKEVNRRLKLMGVKK
jgi:hypothetical protein